jgi:hypothetical protein
MVFGPRAGLSPVHAVYLPSIRGPFGPFLCLDIPFKKIYFQGFSLYAGGKVMFDTLSDKLNSVFKQLKGQGKLSEKNIADGLRAVRMALLEADVHYQVVKRWWPTSRHARSARRSWAA